MNDNKTSINPEFAEMLKKFHEAAQTAPQGLVPPYQNWPQAPCPSCGHCPHCGRGGYFRPYITYTTY